MSRIVIFGRGFIGSRLHLALEGSTLVPTDITDEAAVRAVFDEHRPDVVVNCAGKTGRPNVDWCETNQIPTFRSNVIGALVLAQACVERGIHFVHVGSGCIFYGASPDPRGWSEDDFANPTAFYSRTKYAADLVLSRLPKTAIVRLRMPIDGEPGERNLITKLAGYPKIIDVANSVTVVEDLMTAIRGVIEKEGTGVFHAVNPGFMRHRDLMDLYREMVDPSHQNEWISSDDLVKLGLATSGRSNNFMQNSRLPELGIHMRPIDVALRDCMVTYAQRIREGVWPISSSPNTKS